MPEQERTPFVVIPAVEGSLAKPVSSPEALRKWAADEREAWHWAEEGPLANYYKSSVQQWNNVEAQTKAFIAEGTDQRRNNVKRAVNEVCKSGLKLLSDDPKAARVRYELEEFPDQAEKLLKYFTGNLEHAPYNTRVAVRGAMYELGLDVEKYDSHTKALEHTKADWSAFVKEAKSISGELRSDQNSLQEQTRDLVRDANKKAEATIAQIKADGERGLEEAGQKLDHLIDHYENRLALQAPIQYWTKKGEKHGDEIKKLLGYIGMYVGVLLLIFLLLYALVAFKVSASDLKEILALDFMKTYWPPAILVAIGVVFLWPIRVLTRLVLSNVHLKSACEERVSMVETFLALLRTEDGLKDVDKIKIVLEAIFHPKSLGVVKDDGAPSHPVVELIQRMGDGKS